MFARRSWSIAVWRGEAVGVGDDEVGAEGDDLLDVDTLVGGHDRQVVGGRRVLRRCPRPCRRSGRRRRARTGSRSRRASARRSSGAASGGRRRSTESSLRVSGKVAAGSGVGLGSASPTRRARVEAGRPGRDRHGRRRRGTAAGGQRAGSRRAGPRRCHAGARARPIAWARAHETPRRCRSRGRRRGHRMPTLSLEGSSMTPGSATGLARSPRALCPETPRPP